MKSTGVVRRIDELGRLVIPKEFRNALGVSNGDELEIFLSGSTVVVKKYEVGCTLCGNSDSPMTKLYPDKLICMSCVKIIVMEREKLNKSALEEKSNV